MLARRSQRGRDDRGERARRILEVKVAVRHRPVHDLRGISREHVEVAALGPEPERGHERRRRRKNEQREQGGKSKAKGHTR